MKLVKFYFAENSRSCEEYFILKNDFDVDEIFKNYKAQRGSFAFENPYAFFKFLIEQNYIEEYERCKPVFISTPRN